MTNFKLNYIILKNEKHGGFLCMNKWIYPSTPKQRAFPSNHPLFSELNDVVLQILMNRGFSKEEEIETFLFGDLRHLHDPRMLKDAEKATDIIMEAIQNGKKIVVYGDYDCDGICSTVVMTSSLRQLGGKVEYYTNNRFIHGYGMCPEGVNEILSQHPDTQLIVTVDNGIMAHEGIQYAKEKGLTVVVTDHHDPGDTLPQADAVVNPKRKDCSYPFKELCGAGLAFKLLLLLYWKMNKPLKWVYDTLDIVALATVGDIVPLLDENRILVKKGLEKIRAEDRLVFKMLREVTNSKVVNAHDTLAFYYAPLINSIGRLDGDPKPAIDMFFDNDEQSVRETIEYLKQVNETRKSMTNEQYEIAEKKLSQKGLKPVLVVYHPDFHEGVVGLIASRLKEKYHRPVFVLAKHHDIIKGSGRSIDGFHLKETLMELAERSFILGGGGHAKACGVSLSEEMLDSFETFLNEKANQCLTQEDFQKKYYIDYVLDPHEIDLDFLESLKKLEPFGEAFPKPIFALDSFNVKQVFTMGERQQHLKLISDNLSLIAWNGASLYEKLERPSCVTALGYPQLNIWNNEVYFQFVVEDDNIKPVL